MKFFFKKRVKITIIMNEKKNILQSLKIFKEKHINDFNLKWINF